MNDGAKKRGFLDLTCPEISELGRPLCVCVSVYVYMCVYVYVHV